MRTVIKMTMMALLTFLAACTTAVEVKRVTSPVSAKQFNSLNSKYMHRPTFAEVAEMSNGQSVLVLKMDPYGYSKYGIHPQKSFARQYVQENIALIDKFLKWSEVATQRGDLVDKEIGKAPAWNNSGVPNSNRYYFHSGNEYSHLLEISNCAVGTCADETPFYFDVNGARQLKTLLLSHQSGRLAPNLTEDDPYQ